MSLHNKPLTDLEKTGLIKHGFSTDKPSQMSDAFRLGVSWAIEFGGTELKQKLRCEHDWDADLDYCVKCGKDAFTT